MKIKKTRTANYREDYLLNNSEFRPDLPGIVVHSFCHSILQPQWQPKLDLFPYILVSIILSGEEKYMDIGGDLIRKQPGFFSISDLNFGINIHKRKETLERYFVLLRLNRFLRELLQVVFPAGLPHFMPKHPERLKHRFEDIRRILRRKGDIDNSLLGAMAFRLLCEAAEQLAPTERLPLSLVNALHLIENRFNHAELTRQEIAAAVGISAPALGKMFQTHLHTTVNHYVVNLRLEKAKQLLAKTRYPVAEIASMCGFAHACYFSRIFHRKIGLLPLSYRRNAEQEIC